MILDRINSPEDLKSIKIDNNVKLNEIDGRIFKVK